MLVAYTTAKDSNYANDSLSRGIACVADFSFEWKFVIPKFGLSVMDVSISLPMTENPNCRRNCRQHKTELLTMSNVQKRNIAPLQ